MNTNMDIFVTDTNMDIVFNLEANTSTDSDG